MGNTRGFGNKDQGGAFPLAYSLTELSRRLENTVAVGTVVAVDYRAGKARVLLAGYADEEDKIVTDWIPWGVPSASWDSEWSPKELDEQVAVYCPSGDLANAFIGFSLNKVKFPHDAESVNIRKRVWRVPSEDEEVKFAENPTSVTGRVRGQKRQKAALSRFEEYDRLTGQRREWLRQSGQGRLEVGNIKSTEDILTDVPPTEAKTAIIWDKDHIQLRVGTTQFVIREDSIKLHIKGNVTELLLDDKGILGHVAHKGAVRIDKDEVSASVEGKGLARVRKDKVEAAVEAESVLTLLKDSISAEIKSKKVRIGLFATQIKLWVKTAWLHLTATTADLRVPGSAVSLSATAVTVTSPALVSPEPTVVAPSTATPGAYLPGQSVPPVTVPPDLQPGANDAPQKPSSGNAPSRPKT